MRRNTRRAIAALASAAFLLRLAAGLFRGEGDFVEHGYGFYVTLADNLLAGHGLCYEPGAMCAQRMPLYPVLLAGFIAAHHLYAGVVLSQSAAGAIAVVITWWLGGRLFTPAAAWLAAAAAAFNPYAVWHDAALQDTAFGNLSVLLAIAALVHARRASATPWWALAGLAAAASMMISARFAAAAPIAVTVALLHRRRRASAAVLVTLPIVAVLSLWMTRNVYRVGAAVLTTEAGEALYYGNSPLTFTHYPERSIDFIADELHTLPPALQQQLAALDAHEIARDHAFRAAALDYIREHPAEVVRGALRQLWVTAIAQYTPARGAIVQAGYRLVFLPVHILAVIGLWRARREWRAHAPLWLWLAAFAATTAIYWAHTSHKSVIDPILFLYAASCMAPRPADQARLI